MLKFFNELLAPPVFPGDEEKTRSAELLNTILVALSALGSLLLVVLVVGRIVPLQTIIAVAIFILAMVFLQYPARRGFIKQVSFTVVVLFTGVLTYALTVIGTVRSPSVSLYILIVIISGLIIGRRAAYWTAFIITLAFFGVVWLEVNGRLPKPVTEVNFSLGVIFAINATLAAILLGRALGRINESLERARLGEEKLASLNVELEQRVEARANELAESAKQLQKRASQFEAISNTARFTATAQNLEELLTEIARNVSDRFGFYHVGIFLLDENRQFAILRATNSDAGLKMLARGHRLLVGEQGIVGFAALRGEPRIALNVGEEAVYFNNPDLPDTHSEVALPLKFRNETIGVLDIQSREVNAFSKDDLEIFSILADQVSVAIQNIRSLEQAQRALLEAQSASRQLAGSAWQSFQTQLETKGYRFDGIKPEPLKETGKPVEAREILSVPVQLRGQTIGNLKLRVLDSTRNWTEDERAIVESTAERVAIAMEGARLLDEAQKRAARETFLAGMGARLATSFQVDSILRDTVEELGQTLKGATVSFQLVNPSFPPTVDPSQIGNSSGRKKSD